MQLDFLFFLFLLFLFFLFLFFLFLFFLFLFLFFLFFVLLVFVFVLVFVLLVFAFVLFVLPVLILLVISCSCYLFFFFVYVGCVCACVGLNRAVSRRHCVGGGVGASKISAAAKTFSQKIPEKISFYPQNFLMTFFGHRSKIETKNYTAEWHRRCADKLLAAARRSTKVGGDAHKLSAARPEHGSTSESHCLREDPDVRWT